MNKRFFLVAAAALAIGTSSFTFAQNNPSGTPNSDTSNAGTVRKEAAEKLGIGSADKASEKQSKHSEEIHDVMAQVAEAAFTKTGLDDIVERFVDADRNRLGQQQDALKADDTFKGRIAELDKDWKNKYNQSFDIKDEDKVYNLAFAQVMEGEEGGARTASATVSGDVNTSNRTATGDVNVNNNTGVDKPGVNTNGQTPADTNRNDPGRNIATVHIAASHGMPALDVPFIHEAGGWKIDIPDSVDGNKFRSNILAALTDLGEKKDQWPAEVDDAYRLVTHRVLLGIFDKPATEGAAGASNTNTSNTGTNR